LDDDGSADIRHDAQSSDSAMLEGATSKQAVHAKQATPALGLTLKKIG
jgi:hypothetical protein